MLRRGYSNGRRDVSTGCRVVHHLPRRSAYIGRVGGKGNLVVARDRLLVIRHFRLTPLRGGASWKCAGQMGTMDRCRVNKHQGYTGPQPMGLDPQTGESCTEI